MTYIYSMILLLLISFSVQSHSNHGNFIIDNGNNVATVDPITNENSSIIMFFYKNKLKITHGVIMRPNSKDVCVTGTTVIIVNRTPVKMNNHQRGYQCLSEPVTDNGINYIISEFKKEKTIKWGNETYEINGFNSAVSTLYDHWL